MRSIERFDQFVSTRFTLGDWGNYVSRDQTRVSRKKILEACSFGRSTLYQNTAIKKRLLEVETQLRYASVLRPLISAPDTLLDEECVLTVVVQMEVRLQKLRERMAAFLSSVEDVRYKLQKLDRG